MSYDAAHLAFETAFDIVTCCARNASTLAAASSDCLLNNVVPELRILCYTVVVN